jgi:hypothetical protein
MKRTPLVRAAALTRRGKPLKRKTAMRRVRHDRIRARRAVQFGKQSAMARTLPCFTCGAPPPSDPSHLKTRGAGGLDEHVIPQCRKCHDALGWEGITSFFVKRGLDRHQLLARMRALVALSEAA